MKHFFTEIKLIFIILFLSFSTLIQAQVVLNIDGVGAFKGSLASFGANDPCNFDLISGLITIADDGTANVLACDPFIDANLQGKIAVVNRGACSFERKAANVEANGAIAAIICNNTLGLRPLGQDPNYNVSIPTVLISMQDCFNLTNALMDGNEIDASINPNPVTIPDAVSVVWGDQLGQGEFEGGINGWTVENCAIEDQGQIIENETTWKWYENPIEERFGGQIISYSRCNGAMGYEASAWNEENGEYTRTGGDYPKHNCELISPIIDLTNSGPVTLQFWQMNFALNANSRDGDNVSRLFISLDGGMTYTQKINVESGNIVTSQQTNWANEELIRYYLPQLEGESNVRLKFEFQGDFYAWYIDDVYFIGTPDNSLAIDEGLYGLPPSARTPLSMVEPLMSIGRVQNTGRLTQPNTRIDIEVTGAKNFNTSLDLGNLASDSIALSCNTTDPFTPDAIGNYNITMTADSDSTDFDYTDNSLDFDFEITESIWAKDAGTVNGTVRPASDANFIWGAVYTAPERLDQEIEIESAEFGFELADSIDGSGQFLSWSIYEWSDGNSDRICQASERIQLLSAILEFTYRDGIDGEITRHKLEDVENGSPISIVAGKTYILSVAWNNPERNLLMYGYNGYDYSGMQEAYDRCTESDRYNDVIGLGDAGIDGDWSTGGWRSGVVPAMRLITTPFVKVNDIDQNFSLDLFPNPATNEINIEVEFKSSVNNLEISITDLVGRIQDIQNHPKVSNGTFSFDLSQYDNGVYFAKIKTEEGIATKRFVISK